MRRWKVYLDGWSPDRLDNKHHVFEIPLVCQEGHSESITVAEKKFTTPTFRFRNDGSVTIDPRVHTGLVITFKGASDKLIIRNKTTGDEWSWSGTTVANDVITLEGIRSLKNGTSIFGQTNKKLITIAPGWNNFEVVGATGSFELSIKSRFYFL